MNNIELLREGLLDFGIKADTKMLDRFQKYKEVLVEWNKVMNLTGIEDEREIYIKHFLDSISMVKSGCVKENISVIDVGTGAGFPGIPLKICFENIKLTLLDSLNKRINFLKAVGESLELEGIEYLHARAEDFGVKKEYRQSYDIATARAVAELPVLLEICVPFVKVGGYFICLKGPSVEREIQDSTKAQEVLGVKFIEKIDIKLKESDSNHNILIFQKIKDTPNKYPRKAGKVSKNPIK
ncbi:MAG: 16S rRNA (guanine(527)-N(7))-methyltransferase RsmG [Clostridioides sp.]|jgi:16S rRNA (guanine527-N7)-methyltransferase|nr:16S rRNA (guanine(527)-N(7))-methyltransferase RsmG [Clostridioides sp.]